MIDQPNWPVFALLIIPAALDFTLAAVSAFSRRTQTNIVFALFSISVGLWTFGLCAFGLVNVQDALFWNKVFILSAGFIPATFLHFSFLFNEESLKPRHVFLIYFPSFLIGILSEFFSEFDLLSKL